MSVKVLIVDDSVPFRDELRHQMQCAGCEVVAEAGDTLQALARFRAVSPSLVIIDTGVPQTGGIGALALLRIMRSEDRRVQVLIIGQLALPEVRKTFLREGAADYLIRSPQHRNVEYMSERVEELLIDIKKLPQASADAAHGESHQHTTADG